MSHSPTRRDFIETAVCGITAAAIGLEGQPKADAQTLNPADKKIGFVIHGGAGTIEKSSMTPEREKAYRDALTQALNAGHETLRRGGAALDAVVAAIRIMEDSPLFNAGRGAVFTSAGTNELDSSIMDGGTLKAGAVASLKHIKNPIALARLVMDKSPHVLLIADGAEAFAREQGVEMVDQKYFYTEERWRSLQKIKEREKSKQTGIATPAPSPIVAERDRFGTVGAVALDANGNLAAGTSTGGMTNKRAGRVGDSPIIGAGTYADNRTCAVSATGDGEYFIRLSVARDIAALMEYKGMSVDDAARTVIEKVGKLGGGGGVIALDRAGNFSLPFNTSGMYRGYIDREGRPVTEIYKTT